MPAVLPGKPQAKLHAITTGRREGRRIIAYISGKALIVLTGPNELQQTIYHDCTSVLQAVAFDEASGKIATCSENDIYIYELDSSAAFAKSYKWSQQHLIRKRYDDTPLSTLSWGTSGELLSGSSWLRIQSTSTSVSTLWETKIANTVKFASFSHDAILVASTGHYDTLVKVWRRLSFSSDEIRFEFAYLPHPTTVTGIQWRRSFRRQHSTEHVLYTTCADGMLRVWAAKDYHSLQILELWAEIDLRESIKPRLTDSSRPSRKRFAFLIDSEDFISATERAVENLADSEREHHTLDHLLEVAHRTPEVCVVLDEHGRMSAWGFEGIGSKGHTSTKTFNIAHVAGVSLTFSHDADMLEDYVQIYAFCDGQAGNNVTILAHHFDGRIEWAEAQVNAFFDPSPTKTRLKSRTVWSGHSHPVNRIVRSVSGKQIVSSTNAGEGILWRQIHHQGEPSLAKICTLQPSEPMHKICIPEEDDFVVILYLDKISVWDTSSTHAKYLASEPYRLDGRPLCLILLPETLAGSKVYHVATISSDMKGLVWEIRVPSCDPQSLVGRDNSSIVTEFSTFDLGLKDDLAFVKPVDPAGSIMTISGFLDVFARDVAISFTTDGILRSWTARVDLTDRCVKWLLTSTVETGVANSPLANGSSIRKVAVVDDQKTELTIWDTREGQLEYTDHFGDAIKDLDWTSTPDNQSVLAVGFSHQVLLLAQLRYDYLDGGPAWRAIKEVRLADITPYPIGDSVWLSHGNLAVGAGNQLVVYDSNVNVSEEFGTDLRVSTHQSGTRELFNLVSRLNGPLPVFHPQFLSQCILAGKLPHVQRVLVSLHKHLKFYTEGDELDGFLGLSYEDFLREEVPGKSSKKSLLSSYADLAEDEESDALTESLAASLNEKLTTTEIPQLSGREQFHLADITECVATVEKHRRSIDDNASRFLTFLRQHMLRKTQHGSDGANVSWREIIWAYHSNSQDILVDLVSRQCHGKMHWQQARDCGMFMWLKDETALKAQFEVIARNQYTRNEPKNPIDCSLYYLALRKKTVLNGLWRMAAWNPEQRATQRLLGNNFSEPRWRTAALKNAYALLGRHRFEYAAAFFLLANCLKDAVNVCINQLDDLQLGIAVARVYEGDNGPVLTNLLEDYVLPQAAAQGNRWLATWALWMLNRRDLAVRVLVAPVHTVLENVASPGMQAKLFRSDDPALVALYKQLREKTLQTLQGASKVSPKAEWEFVLHTARLYDRMGCDLLALDLVYNWEFLRQPPKRKNAPNGTVDPRKMLRRRSSLVVADLPSPKLPSEIKSSALKPPPSVFEEPDTSSLLDTFGY